MAKIKKYTIEDTIPDGAVFIGPGNLVTDSNSTGRYYTTVTYFYFLVEEEKGVEPTHILLKCPHCSRDYQSKI